MPNQASSRLLKATGRDVGTGKVITLTKTQPAQLSLFGEFLPPEARDTYSNTLELYDAIPKYFSSKKRAPFKFQLTVLRKPLVVVGWCLHHESLRFITIQHQPEAIR